MRKAKTRAPTNSPEGRPIESEFLHNTQNFTIPDSIKSEKVLSKNINNFDKFGYNINGVNSSLKARLKQITTKKYSPNKKLVPYGNEKGLNK